MLRNPKGVEKNRARTASSHAKPVEGRGFRHPVGSILPVRIVADPAERTWIWNASGTGTVVIEDGNY